MIDWLTADEFKTMFPSTEISEDDFKVFKDSATEDINFITSDKIIKLGFDNLESWVQHRIKRAIAYQILFYNDNGGLDGMTEEDYNSASVGSFSISQGGSSPNISPFIINGRRAHPKIKELLMTTNLLNAAVNGI